MVENMIERLEKIIVDGQKEVLDRIAQVETNLTWRIEGLEKKVEVNTENIKILNDKIEKVNKKVETYAQMLTESIREAEKNLSIKIEKLEEHIHLPVSLAHAA